MREEGEARHCASGCGRLTRTRPGRPVEREDAEEEQSLRERRHEEPGRVGGAGERRRRVAVDEEQKREGDERGEPAGKSDTEQVEGNGAEQVQPRAALHVDERRRGAAEPRTERDEPRHERVVPDPLAGIEGIRKRVTLKRGLGLGDVAEVVPVVRPVEPANGREGHRQRDGNESCRAQIEETVAKCGCGDQRKTLSREPSRSWVVRPSPPPTKFTISTWSPSASRVVS